MVQQDGSSQALTLRLPPDEYEALRTFAFVSKQSINDAVRRAIRLLLATEGSAGETLAMFDAAKGSYRVVVDQISKEVGREQRRSASKGDKGGRRTGSR